MAVNDHPLPIFLGKYPCNPHSLKTERLAIFNIYPRTKVKVSEHTSSQDYLIINTSFEHFRGTAAKAAYDKANEAVILAQEVADALEVEDGDFVRMLAL